MLNDHIQVIPDYTGTIVANYYNEVYLGQPKKHLL